MPRLPHAFYLLLITTVLFSSYYHHVQGEEIDARRFGLSTVGHLEGRAAGAPV